MNDARDSGRFHVKERDTKRSFDVAGMSLKTATRRVGQSFVVGSVPPTLGGCGEMTGIPAESSIGPH